MSLTLERRDQKNLTLEIGAISITPMVREDYWSYRVRLTDTQSVIGFPKFGTIGIGFAVEEDWNTNLPYTCQTIDIVSHIWHNHSAGDPDYFADDETYEREREIEINQVFAAVEMIQDAASADRPDLPGKSTQPGMVDMVTRQVS